MNTTAKDKEDSFQDSLNNNYIYIYYIYIYYIYSISFYFTSLFFFPSSPATATAIPDSYEPTS